MVKFFDTLNDISSHDGGIASLRGLLFWDCNLSDNCLNALSHLLSNNNRLTNLKTLAFVHNNNDFSNNCITNSFLPAIKKSTELEKILFKNKTKLSNICQNEIQFLCDINKGG